MDMVSSKTQEGGYQRLNNAQSLLRVTKCVKNYPPCSYTSDPFMLFTPNVAAEIKNYWLENCCYKASHQQLPTLICCFRHPGGKSLTHRT